MDDLALETLRNIVKLQESAAKSYVAATLTVIGIRAHLDALKAVVSASGPEAAEHLQREIAIAEKKLQPEIEVLQTTLRIWLAELKALQSGLSKTVH